MSDAYDNHLKKLDRKINTYSGKFMSNSKWLKLVKALSANHKIVNKCFIVCLNHDRPQKLLIPPIEKFYDTYNNNGIKDVIVGGPILFKEIKWVEFPAAWSNKRKMREQILEPLYFTQNLDLIQQLIESIGELNIERDEHYLKIYGYK